MQRRLADRLVPTYRSHRPGPTPRGNDDGVNPLLQRRDGTDHVSTLYSSRDIGDLFGGVVRSGRTLLADSPVSILNSLISAMGQGGLPFPGSVHRQGHALHFTIGAGPSGELALPRDFQAMFGLRHPRVSDPPRLPSNDPSQAVSFNATSTTSRWMEEAKLLFGSQYHEKAAFVLNSILAALVPPALEEERARKKKEAEEARKKKEEEEKKREAERLAKEEEEKKK